MSDFAHTRRLFHLPEGVVYLDGNSLGPLPVAARDHLSGAMLAEWGEMLITGWNRAGWIDLSTRIGDRIGRLIGAPAGTTIMGDTLSVKVWQALAAALALNPDRRVILSDRGNFPSDLYIAQGLIDLLDRGHRLKLVAPEEVADAIDEQVAVLLLTEVDYRTGRLHDMAALTRLAHEAGALTVWDLAHSAGAIPVDVTAAGADFAVGCTYKYLNGGPGAPAFIHVAPHLVERALPALSGWLGHRAPFAFDLDYTPAAGIERMRIGTPPVLALKVLEAALDIWEGVDMAALRRRSLALQERFITAALSRCPMLELASPRDGARRGSQVGFRFAQGHAAMQALIDRGVIGDFRAPDIMRFGITPLYLDERDIDRAVEVMDAVLNGRLWDRPEYMRKAKVT